MGPMARARVTAALIGVAALPIPAALVVYLATDEPLTSFAIVVALSTGLAALVAAGQLWHAGRATVGRGRQLHNRLALGCVLWGVGALPYVAFVVSGGSATTPAPWTQMGFLLAYLPWCAALWKVRQPVVVENRRAIASVVAVETLALVSVCVALASALWDDQLPASTNAALLLPVGVDLLMLTAAYSTVRRASLRPDSLYGWLVGAFAALTASDAVVSVGMAGTPKTHMLVAGNLGYVLSFAFMAVAAGRQLHLRESTLAGERLTVAAAAIGLAMVGPAATLAPAPLNIVMWFVGAALAWALLCFVRGLRVSDQDRLTGLWDSKAFARHAGPLAAMASEAHPVGLVAVDLNGFRRWNAERGFVAGDRLLVTFTEALAEAVARPGAWGRLGPDRFAWVGSVRDAADAQLLARRALEATAPDREGLDARAGVVVCPVDAATIENALAAAEEALEAARSAPSRVVCFDRGLLEGANASALSSASYRSRHERIVALLADPESIRSAYQPIVGLGSLDVMGFEALARFQIEPLRGPDWWIAEGHHVGLGVEIEAACARRALTEAQRLTGWRYLAVNASPQLILSDGFEHLFPAGNLDWLVIEVTEHHKVRDYAALADALHGLRARGARVAVDDLGAGHSTFAHITRLRPDIAKLDRSIVEGVDVDGVKQAMVRSMVAFSRETRCTLVAEGVETRGEWETLRALGVGYGQGYLFQPPDEDLVETVRLRREVEDLETRTPLGAQ
ncbi:MAG: EAL domain-containing protein [Thermoleophilia bacterium]|nr:EAL domain-containing protein [Thermoleophilia bacterium]